MSVQKSLEVMGGEIRRLDRVVQGFLRFMRPQEVTFKAVDLNALLASMTALVEAEWQGRGIRVVPELDPALPSISADDELLHQAFLNLMQNACQAMPDGGVLTIRTERLGSGSDTGRGQGRGRGDSRGGPREDLQALLHDQAGR